jgi:hypothetical protein
VAGHCAKHIFTIERVFDAVAQIDMVEAMLAPRH